MSEDSRDTPWQQGDLFDLTTEADGTFTGVIASHDCDLYADAGVEALVEFVPATFVAKIDSRMTFGKNPRRLHSPVLRGRETSTIELLIQDRRSVPKEEFRAKAKPSGFAMTDPDRVVFRGWLAARYNRSAFPGRFEDRLNPLRKKIEKLSQDRGRHVRAIFFDLDEGKMVERDDGDPYELEIWVVYDGEVADPSASRAFAHDLAVMFKEEFLNPKTKDWERIRLIDCHPVSTHDFTYALVMSMKSWRVDHTSYAQLPDSVLPETNR